MNNEKNNENVEPEEQRKEVVIEDFDDETPPEQDELYERYVELMNAKDEDEEDIAAVAERITGVRHSKVSTAAPIRIRENAKQSPPTPTSAPVRVRSADNHAHRTIRPHQPSKKSKHMFRTLITAALVVMLVLSVVVITVNIAYDKKNAPDIPDSEELTTEPKQDAAENSPETIHIETDASDAVNHEETAPLDNITPDDTIEPEPEPEPVVEPEPEFTVTLDFYDRDDITVDVAQMTLSEIYNEVGYTPRETDRPSVSLDYVIAADAYITIDTVEYKSETVTETVPYGSDVIEVDTIPRGTTNYINAGTDGEVVRTYTVEYVNGAEQNWTLQSEVTTKWAVNEKYELGVGGTIVGSDGVTYTYSYRRTVPATYYNIEGLTYLGTMADESVIAVDPDKIPLGTKLYVKNASYDFGVRTAADVGPKVEEWEVDIWLSPGNPQYASFSQAGYHYDMEIYYID